MIKQNQNGLSLIEIMVAFSILMVTFISLMGTFPMGLSINKGAESSSIASYLAQDKIEEINSSDYNSISTGIIEPLQKLSADPENYLYDFERETTINYVDSDLLATTTDTGIKLASTTVYYDNTQKNKNSFSLILLISQK